MNQYPSFRSSVRAESLTRALPFLAMGMLLSGPGLVWNSTAGLGLVAVGVALMIFGVVSFLRHPGWAILRRLHLREKVLVLPLAPEQREAFLVRFDETRQQPKPFRAARRVLAEATAAARQK